MTEDDAIADGMCSQCRAEVVRAASTPYQMAWADVRAERNRRLAACDWTQISTRLSPAKKLAWDDYRNTLFNLPDAFDNPADVIWPTPPE